MTTTALIERPATAESEQPLQEASERNRSSCRLTSHKPQNISELERWSSAAIGSVLLLDSLTGDRGWWSGLLGAALLHRGVTGHCMGYAMLGVNTADHNAAAAVPAQQGRRVEHSIAVNRSPEDLYGFWRDVENLPTILGHLKEVEAIDNRKSRWTVEAPMGYELQWEADIYNSKENEMIAWRSLPGGDVDTAGSVHFKPLGGDRGTEVVVNMKFNPPAGKLGDRVACLFGKNLQQELVEGLRHFKQLMETGEAISTRSQPSGRS